MKFAPLLALPVAIAFATPASAVTLVADTGWIPDTLLAPGFPTVSSPFTFTVTSDASFKLTDAFIPGDTFQLFKDGVLLATSSYYAGGSLPQYSGDSFYQSAWEDAAYSKIDYLVSAGTYSVIVLGDGAAGTPAGLAVRLDTLAVPEPATWGLMILGFGAVGAAMRRRKTSVSVRYA